jgi:hypothetical protein
MKRRLRRTEQTADHSKNGSTEEKRPGLIWIDSQEKQVRKDPTMFEVVISNVKTGRVRHRFFETRAAADRYVEERLEKVSARPNGSARQFRFEVYHRELPAVRSVSRVAPAA